MFSIKNLATNYFSISKRCILFSAHYKFATTLRKLCRIERMTMMSWSIYVATYRSWVLKPVGNSSLDNKTEWHCLKLPFYLTSSWLPLSLNFVFMSPFYVITTWFILNLVYLWLVSCAKIMCCQFRYVQKISAILVLPGWFVTKNYAYDWSEI